MTTGRNSKSALTKLSSQYLDGTKSGLYLSNQSTIRVIDQRIISLLDRVADNDTPNRVKRLIDNWNTAKRYMRLIIEDDKNSIRAYNAMEHEATKAYHDYESWMQIFNAMDLRTKTTAAEVKIWKDMQAMLTAKDAFELAAQLLAAVINVLREEPNGQKYIALIRHQFAVIIGEADADNVEGGGAEIIDIDPLPVDRDPLFYSGDVERPSSEGEDTASSVSEGLPE